MSFLQHLQGQLWAQRRASRVFTSPRSVITLCCCLVLLLLWWFGVNSSFPPGPGVLFATHDSTSPASSYFHLIVPASEESANLCKTLFSAAILGYPTPRIINWHKTFHDPNLLFGGSHIAKIDGIAKWLDRLGPGDDDHLVLIVDGYDVWFQLRPSVLIERYHDINRRANERIAARLGSRATRTEGIQQTVVFASQKRCWPAGEDDPACFAVPFSELPRYVYGPDTDTDIGDEQNPYVKFRSRFLNSGTIIGPVSQLRRIFQRAVDKAKLDSNIGSDQGVFAAIFGEQEYQREVIRARYTSWLNVLIRFLSSKVFGRLDPRDAIISPHPTHHRMDAASAADVRSYEFGIGIDYRSELSQPTVFSENDLAWISPDERRHLQNQSEKSRMSALLASEDLDQQVERSTPPFWIDTALTKTANDERPWASVPLYTNLWTGIAPAAIHHNAHRDGLKGRIETFWNETWFFPRLRDTLTAQAYSTRMPCAVVPDDGDDTRTKEWWSPIDERNGVMVENGRPPGDFQNWHDICGGEEIAEQVFRDGRGPWTSPVTSLSWDREIADRQLSEWKLSRTGERET